MASHGLSVRMLVILCIAFMVALYLFIGTHTDIFSRLSLIHASVPKAPNTGLAVFDKTGYVFTNVEGGIRVPYIAYRNGNGIATKRLADPSGTYPDPLGGYYGSFADVKGTVSFDTVEVASIAPAPADAAFLAELPPAWSRMQ